MEEKFGEKELTEVSNQNKSHDEMFCASCGKAIKKEAFVCPHCGVKTKKTSGDDKNKIVAALLAIFLGSFGAHKFYLKRIGMGILYLVFCWTMIPGIIAFIEGIILLCIDDDKFNAKYNN